MYAGAGVCIGVGWCVLACLVCVFEILGVGYDTANQDTEGIEHHLNPKTIKQLRKFITFLKADPKIIENFKNL